MVNIGLNTQADLNMTNNISWRFVIRSNIIYYMIFLFIFIISFRMANIQVLHYLQIRPLFISLHDPVFRFIPYHNFNTQCEILFQVTQFIMIGYFLKNPLKVIIYFQALCFIWITRWLTIYLLPFSAPHDKIPLLNYLNYGNYTISRDLFFSGHTAAVVIMIFNSDNRLLARFGLLSLLTMIILMLFSRWHYTIDIVIAPYIAYCYYSISLFITKKMMCWLKPRDRSKLCEANL